VNSLKSRLNQRIISTSKALFKVIPVTPKTEWLAYEIFKPFLKKGVYEYKVNSVLKMNLDVSKSCMMFKRAVDIFEPETYSLFTRLIHPGMTFIDAGGCVGDFSILASRIVGESGRVVVFEPNINNFRQLSSNIDINNCTNVSVFNLALGSDNGEIELTSSLSGSGDSIHGQINSSNTPQKYKATIRSLDSISEELKLDNIDIIKIDVEGHELELLKGALKQIESNPNIKLCISLHPQFGVNLDEVMSFLQKHGFIAYYYENGAFTEAIRLSKDKTDIIAAKKGVL
tara:strand:- start:518 stop:1375 length:858 start_codon:yes stop_codon:yes gene_type:complete